MTFKLINARLRGRSGLFQINIQDGYFTSIESQTNTFTPTEKHWDVAGNLVCPPFVEPHIHLDATLTAGEPEWNYSGTLFEGIERWAQRKPLLNREDIRSRVLKTIELLIGQGVQYIRAHTDTTDPSLVGIDTLCELRDELRDTIELQIVAFPQDGILSYPNGEKLLEAALERGADIVGGIPHFEYTRELAEASIKTLIRLALKYNKSVDVHCDEIDDPNSRYLEVLAAEALFNDLGAKVTASHTTAMHSYDNAYCSKLFRLLAKSGINFVSCPTESIHLQGRFDTYPKRRGLTRVKELHAAGINVCFGQDSIFDPWYSLGNGKLLRTLDFGLHICQMMGYQDFAHALDFITTNSAKTLGIENYGIELGNPANFIILQGSDDYSVLRNQADVLLSVRKGNILMQREPSKILINTQW
ncbi:MAG: cytosine deaminase [Thiothrix sp.]|nr:MAG: cytosine deaminase [Thiothrix sp.]